jgi:hypothetical protein
VTLKQKPRWNSRDWEHLGVRKVNAKAWRSMGVDASLLDELHGAHPRYFPLSGTQGIKRMRKLQQLGFRRKDLEDLLETDFYHHSSVLLYVLKRLNTRKPVTREKLFWLLDVNPEERYAFYREVNFMPEGV